MSYEHLTNILSKEESIGRSDSQLPIIVLVLPYEILIYTYTLLHFICLEKWKCKGHITKIWSLASLEAFLEVAGKGFQNMVFLYSPICGELSLLTQEKKNTHKKQKQKAD